MHGKLPILAALALAMSSCGTTPPQRQVEYPSAEARAPYGDARRSPSVLQNVRLQDFPIEEQRTYTDRNWPFINPESGEYRIRRNPETGEELLLSTSHFPIARVHPVGGEYIAERNHNDMVERTRYKYLGEDIETVYHEHVFGNGNSQRMFGPLRPSMHFSGYPVYRVVDAQLIPHQPHFEHVSEPLANREPGEYLVVSYDCTDADGAYRVGRYLLSGVPLREGKSAAWVQKPMGVNGVRPDIPGSALQRTNGSAANLDDLDRGRLEDFCTVVPQALRTAEAQVLCGQLPLQ